MERLVFRYGTSGHGGEAPPPAPRPAAAESPEPPASAGAAEPDRRDWAFTGLMMFTALLFFRPQDLITPLRVLHLAELAAIFALGALIMGRLSRGQSPTRLTPELIGVLSFGAVILLTAPFSIWMGGAIGTFTDMYAKVVLIFLLMVNTLTTQKRIEQFTWLLVIASGYIGGRAVLDYARGINLIENGRVQGAVGGMFKNPNDLALNMVAVLPLAVLLALRPYRPMHRGIAAFCGLMMLGAIVATQSRSGFVGLAAVVLFLALHVVRRRPGLVFAGVLAGLLALPLLPDAYWARMASITNEKLDQTGSREARSILLREAFDAFKAHPLTGVGAGQFKNYDPEGRQEAWRESHNVVLQVAAEIGILGVLIWVFLVARAFYGPMQTRSLLRSAAPPGRRRHPPSRPWPREVLSAREHEMFATHAAALSSALVGWFVCAMFASVAYHWTFYYLLALAVTPRDYLAGRLAAAHGGRKTAANATVATVGAHA